MSTAVIFIIVVAIIVAIIAYRLNDRGRVYKFISKRGSKIYDKYAPYSFKEIRKKVKDLGQEYTKKQYTIQIGIFFTGAFIITFLYFYSIWIALIYAFVALLAIPYLTYLRCKRVYSEFIFEQIQVYTTNTIMEFATTQSFVKALEGVYKSGVLEEPVKSDVQVMIEMSYTNGTIDEALEYMNAKYDYYIVKNMHQLFLQITNEGSRDAGESLENMSQDIDMLVENVYRDRIDRKSFHKKFLTFGIVLYLMVMLIQFLLGVDTYREMVRGGDLVVPILLHIVVILNTFFLLSGEKYYNENVGAE